MKKVLSLALLSLFTPLAAAQGINNLRIMAPASPGGGWDQTSRAIQTVLQDQNIVKPVQVFNVPGAGGTIGLAQLYNSKGDGNLLMTMGLVMVGAIQTNNSKVDLSRVTPIARLTGEYEVLVVPASSPYKTMQDLAAAWKANPGGVAIAGGSAGGTDHMLVGLLAKEAGVDPRKMNYVPFSGGGETLAAVLGNQVAAGVAGYGEFEAQIKAGKLRALGISAPKRQAGIPVPTFKEQGLNVDLANWRGIVAPPGISASEKAALVAALDKMHASKEWKDMLATRNWTDLYLSGSKFDVYLKLEANRTRNILKDIGLVK
ncbi:tripartite tricarboxylate transporter substrate binding protein [Deinococcus metallilatus]|uniref:Tricarboxylic transport membrane protein n=2 Tax=Deinococcus TaxID=1298 RepID=A0AAJ5F288_9DEIO|nr:tripartite tricarboxylate transporter substrate binding protein [Deinococcus metallilatus]MBB5295225.1 putative tricarboxylic transport membrane protein [Deinococcus metallilatus]QBY08613.1 tripartite tricarboxylate transporter substrate binding protein [Deinococcus metallilatus]RXJ10492.1 tripartite tricarboxylate transporter substrate binding protein [Deinococcus metallilatus]TLK26463.1 tripartite tricarboxylate transporter substrate binding protein [Deinococcus metallilatus]GMA14999.1 C4